MTWLCNLKFGEDVDRIIVSRFLYDDSSVLIYDTKKKENNFRLDNQNIEFNNNTKQLLFSVTGYYLLIILINLHISPYWVWPLYIYI